MAAREPVKVEPENERSARVALRAGFTLARRIHEQNGTVYDRYERTLPKAPVVRIAGEADIDAACPLATQHEEVRAASADLGGLIDIPAATAVWEQARRVPGQALRSPASRSVISDALLVVVRAGSGGRRGGDGGAGRPRRPPPVPARPQRRPRRRPAAPFDVGSCLT
ncbi:hypothetical protein AB0N09_33180 [Streptomyces erythrochromogenes]|uniref:hypothetical protein n=1 Tax=Streptomyces erythrochromogenes TaxID=285574 RepID=UPI00343113E4